MCVNHRGGGGHRCVNRGGLRQTVTVRGVGQTECESWRIWADCYCQRSKADRCVNIAGVWQTGVSILED